ncbi:aminoglycoside phosphotransferase family protein [Nonomuraea sp. RK-328]|nr:aminoglycoside phosphotransferase family protein [Nonomuraea sp. RK-328]
MTFPRVPRLDVELALRDLPVPLAYDGPCPGGQVGAVYVRRPDGRRLVLTRGPDVRAFLDVARAGGIPAPRYELVHPPVVVQELLPGSPPGPSTLGAAVRSMAEVNRRARGLLAGRPDLPPLPLHLREDGPGFCLHEPLRVHDARTRRLLGQIEEVGAAVPEVLDGDDLVHTDFHTGNVLVDGTGRVTGVVDWDGAARGDGRFDLFTLRFDLERRAPELRVLLDELMAGDLAPAPMAAACWAHMSLRQVDWSIRHHTAADVTAWLDIAERLRPPL